MRGTHLLQRLLIYRHLDRNVRETLVDGLVGARLERGVVFAVGVEVRYGANPGEGGMGVSGWFLSVLLWDLELFFAARDWVMARRRIEEGSRDE